MTYDPASFSLRTRLFATIAFVLLGTLLIGGAMTYWHAQRKVRVELDGALAAAQRTIELALEKIARLDRPAPQVQDLVRSFDESRHVRLSLLGEDGKPIVVSAPRQPPDAMPAWFLRLVGSEASVRVALPLALPVKGVLLLETDSRNEVYENWGDLLLLLTTLAVFCLLVLALVYALIGRALTPLEALLAGFGRIGDGSFGQRIEEEGPLEFRRLSSGFNRMSSMLADIESRNRKLKVQLETVQEEERAGLARDLHDEVSPLLFSVDVDATTIMEIAATGTPADVVARAQGIQNAANQMKDQIRTILSELRPGVLVDLGLAIAVENLAAIARARHPDIDIKIDVPHGTWGPRIDITLYSLVREALSNALQHGNPAQIDIRVWEPDERHVSLSVSDDGGGLKASPSGVGFGLIGMRERVAELEGTFQVSQRPDAPGVVVSAVIPGRPTASIDRSAEKEQAL